MSVPADDSKERAEAVSIGGMRRTAYAVAKVPGLAEQGLKVGKALEVLLTSRPRIVKAIDDALHATTATVCPVRPEDLAEAQAAVASVIGCNDRCRSVGCRTELNDNLLESCRRFCRDPDDQPEVWCRTGGPLGLRLAPEDRGFSLGTRTRKPKIPKICSAARSKTLEMRMQTPMKTHGKRYKT